jgi:hypothetical protein
MFELEFVHIGECDVCGRAAWDKKEIGKKCDMIQPDTTRCNGVFKTLNPSPKKED